MASKEQKEIMAQWHDHTGFEFMSSDDVRADDAQGFVDVWQENIQWLEGLISEADTIIKPYRDKRDAIAG